MAGENSYIIGIDEAGRGPLAGPVAVGAVCIPKNFRQKNRIAHLPLRDSKKLPESARKAWFKYLTNHPKIACAVSLVSPQTIDKINIAEAVNLAASRALQKLISRRPEIATKGKIYMDAGIKINEKILAANNYSLILKSLIRGDEKINAIKLASVAAKVTRDGIMDKINRKFPDYAFSRHKGYGTKIHLEAIKLYGPSPIHRLTFIGKYLKIKTNYH